MPYRKRLKKQSGNWKQSWKQNRFLRYRRQKNVCDKRRTDRGHGGQITKWGDTYYWYGEDRSQGYYSVGVHLYTSKDLYHWEDKGLVMKMMSEA